MNQRFNILLAEDNPVSSKLIENMLKKVGHEVTTASNGSQALELFNEKFFPIVLTDWMMPEMDGLDLCKAIRNSSPEGYVYIILLTARDSKDDIVAGLKAGADDYLSKPISHLELIARLNSGIRILKLERSLKLASEEIRILSITDALTGCFNRGYLNEHLLQEIMRSKRYNHSLSVVMCDIDHFKQVNDTYGHQTGDRVLIAFAQVIREKIREKIDWSVRYGGEEFLVVLPETEINNGCITAERLRQAVSQMEIKVQDKAIKVTASFGVTGFDIDTDDGKISPDSMINRADEHLYKAKREGRNRVCAGPL